MKKIFIGTPLIIFIIVVYFAHLANNAFWQNLFFCIASANLGIIATFLVVDNYYKRNEIIENQKILFNLVQNFCSLTHFTYFMLVASYKIPDYEPAEDSNMFLNQKKKVKEIEKMIKLIETIDMNDFSCYKIT